MSENMYYEGGGGQPGALMGMANTAGFFIAPSFHHGLSNYASGGNFTFMGMGGGSSASGTRHAARGPIYKSRARKARRMLNRRANRTTQAAWHAFSSGGEGAQPLMRFANARKAVRGTLGRKIAGKAGIRTLAAMARPLTGVASAYFSWGWMLPMAAEMGVAGFQELARMGREFRRATPETSVGYRDMALRERAFTMRQSSLMAIHTSQSGARAALGSEASFLHG